ncbi:MAG: hypothetical protein K0R03_2117 [Moraxellaceae bacterium]|jgi:class 3 adenylate cyclase|nr:hypothetical protein [Moraxellaceae bacterium]
MGESYSESIRRILGSHYAEAFDGVVDKPPSRLLRGEGTERPYFILKIDLVESTRLLLGKRRSTYLKLAHVFLSTVDRITQDFGADASQVEYAGDSVLAYFPEDRVAAEDVILAACYARAAVKYIQELDAVLGALKLQSKVVLHHGTLLMSKIGPRANTSLTAIGMPIHVVSKIEKEISPGMGRVTKEFFDKVDRQNRKFFLPVRRSVAGLSAPFSSPDPAQVGNEFYRLFGVKPPPQRESITPPVQPELPIIGYSLNWVFLNRVLGIS